MGKKKKKLTGKISDFGSGKAISDEKVHAYIERDVEEGVVINENISNLPQSYQGWTDTRHNEFTAVGHTQPKLPAGFYTLDRRHGVVFFIKQNLAIDDLIEFKDSISDSILLDIESFWESADKFEHYGFLHRRGYLLYGPAGSGKTALVQLLIARIVARGGIVLSCNTPYLVKEALPILRETEPDRNIICLFEDIDAIIQRHGEEEVLSILDGESQVDKVLNLATTNYPEKLDKRLVARPRRFDRVVYIGMPNESVRREFFRKKLNLDKNDLDKWSKSTEGLSFAALADLVISVKCLDNDFSETVELLKDQSLAKASSDDYYRTSAGFSGE